MLTNKIKQFKENLIMTKFHTKAAATAVVALSLAGSVAPATQIPFAPITVHADDPSTAGVINVNYVTLSGQVLYSTVVKGAIGDSTTIVANSRVLGYLPDIASHGEVVGGDQNDHLGTHTNSNGDSTILFNGLFGPQPKTVNFYYNENIKNDTISIIDSTTGTPLEDFTLTGQEGTSSKADFDAKIAEYAGQGYELDNTDYNPMYQYYDQSYTVNLKHKLTVTEDNRTKNRTINFIDEIGNVLGAPVVQTTTFKNTETLDNVTGVVTQSGWDKANATFAAVTPSAVYGYDVKGPQLINSLTVDPNSEEDMAADVFYAPKTVGAKITVTDVNDSTNPLLADTINVQGKFGTMATFDKAAKIKALEANGYEYISDSVGAGINLNSETTQNFDILVKHQMKTAEEVDAAKRTISFVYSDGDKAAEQVVQQVNYKRTSTTDQVTKGVTYTPWTPEGSATWNEYKVPSLKGYTADVKTVAEQTGVAQGTKNESVKVTYVANDEEAKVNFVDQVTGQTITTDRYTGKYNSGIKFDNTTLNDLKAKGYTVIADPTSTSQKFDEAGQQKVLTVKLGHAIDTKNESKAVTRTFNLKHRESDSVINTITQTVTFSRSIKTDKVTGDVDITNWASSNPQFEKISFPEIDGYKLDDIAGMDAKAVKHDDVSETHEVAYKTAPKAPAQAPDQEPGQPGAGTQGGQSTPQGSTNGNKTADTDEQKGKKDDAETGIEVPTFMASASMLALSAFAFMTGKLSSKKAKK